MSIWNMRPKPNRFADFQPVRMQGKYWLLFILYLRFRPYPRSFSTWVRAPRANLALDSPSSNLLGLGTVLGVSSGTKLTLKNTAWKTAWFSSKGAKFPTFLENGSTTLTVMCCEARRFLSFWGKVWRTSKFWKRNLFTTRTQSKNLKTLAQFDFFSLNKGSHCLG